MHISPCHPRIAFTLVTAALVVLGTVTRLPGAPRAEFRSDSIVIRDAGKEFVLPECASISSIHRTLHAVCKRGQDYFIVFGYSEYTRGSPRGGHCGAGVESRLCWLHVRGGEIMERHEGLYESCIKDRYDGALQWKDGKLTCVTEGLRKVSDKGDEKPHILYFKWVFDPQNPEKGLTASEERAPNP